MRAPLGRRIVASSQGVLRLNSLNQAGARPRSGLLWNKSSAIGPQARRRGPDGERPLFAVPGMNPSAAFRPLDEGSPCSTGQDVKTPGGVRPGVLVAHEHSTQRGTSSDSSGMTTVRLQRLHLSSTPSLTRRANKLPQAQRRSSCAQAPRGLEGTMRSSIREVRADCVMDVLDDSPCSPSAIESHYQ